MNEDDDCDPEGVAIRNYGLLSADERAKLTAGLDEIFFVSSARQAFRDDAERAAFRWLWFGRYLAEEPEHTFVAVAPSGRVLGYLAGSLDDPVPREAFRELDYFQDFAALTARYPAHLHINLTPCARGRGIGARLIEAFADHARAAGAPGMHVVTGAGMRNVSFYARTGFRELARTVRGRGVVVFLARDLRTKPPAGRDCV